MLFEFIAANRDALIDLTRAKIAKRLAPRPTDLELTSGVPLFLDQVAETLRHAPDSTGEAMDLGAAVHGAALLGRGYTVAQVVHDYGEICQAITELADSLDAPITTEEFQTLNRCLDNAIAEAVTEFARLRDRSMAESETERSGVFAHELRNRIATAQIAFTMIKNGRAPAAGSVANVVTRSLNGMTALVNRSLVEVRVDSGTMQRQRIRLHELMEQAEVDGSMQSGTHGISLSVSPTDRSIEVDADPQILAGAIANILQNAFKFTHAGGNVSLRATAVGNRVEIEIEDECGGLPPGKTEQFFGAFKQGGSDRSGLGLGLFISRKGVEASDGVIRVRNIPGRGCVFTIDLGLLRHAA
ncbi:MAG: sensor histidine kinase [Polyangiaceae bacterium]